MKATESPVIICSFQNIRPINSVEEGIQQGHYHHFNRFITDKTVPLQRVEGEKTIHIVSFNPDIDARPRGGPAGAGSKTEPRSFLRSPQDERELENYNRAAARRMEYDNLLRRQGKYLCQDGPNYLLGLMAQVPEEKMLRVLYSKSIVALSSIFTDERGLRCFLYVGEGRYLGLAPLDWNWSGWPERVLGAFLAEDSKISPQADLVP